MNIIHKVITDLQTMWEGENFGQVMGLIVGITFGLSFAICHTLSAPLYLLVGASWAILSLLGCWEFRHNLILFVPVVTILVGLFFWPVPAGGILGMYAAKFLMRPMMKGPSHD